MVGHFFAERNNGFQVKNIEKLLKKTLTSKYMALDILDNAGAGLGT